MDEKLRDILNRWSQCTLDPADAERELREFFNPNSIEFEANVVGARVGRFELSYSHGAHCVIMLDGREIRDARELTLHIEPKQMPTVKIELFTR